MTPQPPAAATLLEHLADAVYLLDPVTSNVIWCNRAAYQDLGLSAEEVLNHSVLSLQKDVTGLPQWSDIAQVIRNHPCYTFVGRHRHQDGSEIPVEVNTTHFTDEQGREYFLSVARNISNRTALEADLKARNHQLWFALNEAMDGMWDWHIPSSEVFFSPQLKRMLGYGPDEMPPTLDSWTNNVHPDDLSRVIATLQNHLQGKQSRYEAEYRLRNRNGEYLWVHDRGRICERDSDQAPTRVVGMVQNITERKLLEMRLNSLAHIDELTGLPNRRAGQLQIEQQLAFAGRQQHPLCLGIIDLDHFKSINDQLGHAKGDQVLQKIAHTLRATLRKSDHIFRWGGEEFIILLPNTGTRQCQRISDKLHRKVAGIPWTELLGIPPVTLSIGFACYPDDHLQAGSLLALADGALYRAKSGGRNQTRFATSHQT